MYVLGCLQQPANVGDLLMPIMGLALGPAQDDQAAILSCAADLLRAVHAKDVQAIASALRAAHDILDSEPHEEAQSMPHDEEE